MNECVARVDWERPSKVVALGVLIVVFVVPVAFLVAVGLSRTTGPGSGSFWLPSPTLGFLDLSLATSGAPVNRILGQVIVDLVLFGLAIVYYLLIAIVVFGGVLIVSGGGKVIAGISRADLASLRDRSRQAATTLRGLLARRGAQAAVVVAGAIGLLFLSPYRLIILEVVLLLSITTVGMALFGGLTLTAYHRSPGPLVDRVLVYPLAVLALVVPPLIAGLVSPTFGPILRRLGAMIVGWGLDVGLSITETVVVAWKTRTSRTMTILIGWLGVQLAIALTIGVLTFLTRRIAKQR